MNITVVNINNATTFKGDESYEIQYIATSLVISLSTTVHLSTHFLIRMGNLSVEKGFFLERTIEIHNSFFGVIFISKKKKHFVFYSSR